jgi:hypothetical protein
MGYNRYEHKGTTGWPLNSRWFVRGMKIDEDGDIQCSFCPKSIPEGENFWAYNWKSEKRVRCDECITKVGIKGGVKDGYDYTVVDLFKYRKPAELHMMMLKGEKASFLPKISMTMIFRFSERYRDTIKEKRAVRATNRPSNNRGRIYVFDEDWYTEYIRIRIIRLLKRLSCRTEEKNWVSGNLIRASLELSDEGLVIVGNLKE